MAQKNGYFKIDSSDSEHLQLIVYPPENGGERVMYKEAQGYLKSHQIFADEKQLQLALNGDSEKKIPLTGTLSYTVNEEVMLNVSPDSLKLYARFYPATDGGDQIGKDDIEKEMKLLHLRAEIKDDELNKFFNDRTYCTDYLIAEGKAMQPGVDGYVEYLFNTDSSRKPTVKEDGTVDYFNLNTVVSCAKGQKLAILHPEKEGVPGVDVYGNKLLPPKVNRGQLKFGKEVEISEDGMELYSKSEGHVTVEKEKVEVSGVMEFESIDTSTGNIENFEGNLLIKGNIKSGFRVSASGDIEVQGIIEAAEVTAGGQITVAKGINGRERAIIKSEKNIIAHYIENATVKAEGYVMADAILNSHVDAGDNIVVKGKKGLISGGRVRALKNIQAKVIGSTMGVTTEIDVGTDPEKKQRLIDLEQANVELRKMIDRIKPVLLATKKKIASGEKITPDMIAQTKVISEKFVQAEKELGANNAEIEVLKEQASEATNAYIEVEDVAHPGTQVVISDTRMVLRSKYNYCRLVIKDGEVGSTPL
ncbi:MAG: FapA family protein [Lachnospiraceae bacterium]|nr:FapA family protein [Lachnospiraceae bacterium]